MATGASGDYFSELSELLENTASMSVDLADDLLADSNASAEYIEDIEKCTLRLSKLANHLEILKTSSLNISRTADVSASEDPEDLRQLLESAVTEGLKKDFDPVNHRFYTELKKCLANPEEEESSSAAVNGEEEDLVVDRVQKSLYCPITRKLLEKPVTSSVCGHSYSRDAIMGHIRRRPTCPACNQPVTSRDLTDDKPLERMVNREKRRLRQQTNDTPAAIEL